MLSPLQAISLFNLIKSFVLATTYSRPEGLPLVLAGLTSLFGMGRGVAPPSSHQNKTFNMLSARGGSASGGNFSVRNGKRCDHCVKSPTLNNEFFISLIFRTGHASLCYWDSECLSAKALCASAEEDLPAGRQGCFHHVKPPRQSIQPAYW